MDNKDLILFLQSDLSIPLNKDDSMERMRTILGEYINNLIENNFQQLVNLLYRVDVSEYKLKQMLTDSNGGNAGLVIADLIIERQTQKIEARKEFKQKDDTISDEEKW